MSITPFEKCCIVRRYLPSTNPAQTIVLKYENNLEKSFTPSIHNLHLFHLCHNLKIEQDITFLHVFPDTIDVKNIEYINNTLKNSHGVQNPRQKVVRDSEFKTQNSMKYIFKNVPFNNMDEKPPKLRKVKRLLQYENEYVDEIYKNFFYLYPIIAMRESLFRYDKKYPNTLHDYFKQYLQDIKFIGEPYKAFNQHVFNLFPWNDVYYAWYNHSKVIHYYNILFLLFQVGGDIDEGIKASDLNDLHNIPFVDEEKKKAWRDVCKSFDEKPFYDEFYAFNIPLYYNQYTYANQKHIIYEKHNINDVSLITVGDIETNIRYLRHKVHKFLKKIGKLTLDNYNVLSNWNYSLIPDNNYVLVNKVFKNLQKFSLYQVQCIEAHLDYKFRFNKRFTLILIAYNLHLEQVYYCMHQYMPKDNEGIPLNTKNRAVKEAVKEVIDFDKNVKLYDDWVGPLLTKVNEVLGKEKVPKYGQKQAQTMKPVIDLSLQYLLM